MLTAALIQPVTNAINAAAAARIANGVCWTNARKSAARKSQTKRRFIPAFMLPVF